MRITLGSNPFLASHSCNLFRVGSSSVVGFIPIGFSSLLQLHHFKQDPFAPRELPRFFTTTSPSDFRYSQSRSYVFLPSVVYARFHRSSNLYRISQVPSLFFMHALSILTPTRPLGAFAYSSPAVAGFVISENLSPRRLFR